MEKLVGRILTIICLVLSSTVCFVNMANNYEQKDTTFYGAGVLGVFFVYLIIYVINKYRKEDQGDGPKGGMYA